MAANANPSKKRGARGELRSTVEAAQPPAVVGGSGATQTAVTPSAVRRHSKPAAQGASAPHMRVQVPESPRMAQRPLTHSVLLAHDSPTSPSVGAQTEVPPAGTQSKPPGHSSWPSPQTRVHQASSPRAAQNVPDTQSSFATQGSPISPRGPATQLSPRQW